MKKVKKGKLPAHLNCLLRRGKRQEARGNSKGIGGDSANLKNKCFKCVLAYSVFQSAEVQK
ncbi:hypothetical protein OA58_01435 [Microcystis aeruginosa NIES-88]|nr:hypothetical protein OA58_01435 [Microcystis aeruginosa NIES-88]